MTTSTVDVQTNALEDLTEAVNYRRWLVSLGAGHLGDDPLEVGAGIGDYAVEWLDTAPRLTATESDEQRLSMLRARFADEPRVAVRPLTLPTSERGSHSAVVAFNVLEHIADDVAALRSAARLLRPGGAVVLIVPAFPSAMSRFDRAIGHVRRYRRATLTRSLTEAGLVVEQVRYVNPIGLLNWYVFCVALRWFPGNGPLLRVYDRLVVPVARALERRWRPPFGQSLFAVARKPEQ